MKNEVLVFVEGKEGDVAALSLQLLSKGRELADTLGGGLAALVVGSQVGPLVETVRDKGADEVVVVESPQLQVYHAASYGPPIAQIVKEVSPSLFLLGHTFLGIEMGPAVSEPLNAPLLTNVVDVGWTEGTLTVVRPMFGGTKHVSVKVKDGRPVVLTVQSGAFPVGPVPPRKATITHIAPNLGESAMRSRVNRVFQSAVGEVDLAKADIIVSAGRGLGDKSNLRLVEALAEALGGVVACSRPLADLGWLPKDRLVGLSGREVRPRVYLACGISGASQHLAGMQGAQTIIAINKDPGAPIFEVAHYGVVADLLQVLPVLAEEARKVARPWLQRG